MFDKMLEKLRRARLSEEKKIEWFYLVGGASIFIGAIVAALV